MILKHTYMNTKISGLLLYSERGPPMIERDLYEQYRFTPQQYTTYRTFHAFVENGEFYCIVPVPHQEDLEILEIKQMSDYMKFHQGEQFAQIIPTNSNKLVGSVAGERVVLLKLPRRWNIRQHLKVREGEFLARFHKHGLYYPYPPQQATRLGMWRELWQNRLDQMEMWWKEKTEERPANRFEELFFETFPYYLGLTENAIQYYVDCMWDDKQNEVALGTICFLKYGENSLNDLNSSVILPTELIYDHPSRDIAESIRTKYLKSKMMEEITGFLQDYENIMPISFTTWKLMFARLLFPLPFFENVEGYYYANSDEMRTIYSSQFIEFIKRADDYEQFLQSFFQYLRMKREIKLPEIDWLCVV